MTAGKVGTAEYAVVLAARGSYRRPFRTQLGSGDKQRAPYLDRGWAQEAVLERQRGLAAVAAAKTDGQSLRDALLQPSTCVPAMLST